MSTSSPASRERFFAELESKLEYCLYPQAETSFSDWENMTLSGGVALERLLRVLAKKFDHVSLADLVFESQVADARTAIEFYNQDQFVSDPENFFERPNAIPKVCTSRPHKLSWGEVVDLNFVSHFEPHYQPFRTEYDSYPENHLVHARLWRHPPGKSLGTIVAVHGWFMGDQRVNAIALVPGYFYRLGLDVLLYELPYHGRRTPQKKNGMHSLFPSAHLPRTNEAMAQAIFDLRALSTWLQLERPQEIGVCGVSLGGYAAALWASLDKLSFVIPIVPMVSMADLAWSIFAESESAREKLKGLGNLGLEDLKRAYALHCPLNYQPKVEKSRQMIIAGLADRIVPSLHPQMLWEHWKEPRIHWFQGGHFGEMSKKNVFEEVRQFLVSLNLAHEVPLEVSPA